MSDRLAEFEHRLPGTGMLVTTKRVRRCTTRQALRCALRGLREAWATQPNFQRQTWVMAAVIACGMLTNLALTEWLWIVLAGSFVLVAELLNTTIEGVVDLTVGLAPNPLARQIKDIAAGCVLMAALVAVLIGCLVFFPHVVPRS